MNDKQKVALIATGVIVVLFGAFWAAAQVIPGLATDNQAIAIVLPLVIGFAVIVPVWLRRAR